MKQILDKIPRPPGAIPARAQTWLLLGLTAAIVATLLLFPGQPERPLPAAGLAAMPGANAPGTPVGVQSVESAARRMREEAARDAERRMRGELGIPAPRRDGLPHPPTPLAPTQDAAFAPTAGYAAGPSAAEQIEHEEAVRRYRSLRAPPLVLSNRGQLEGAAAEGPSDEAATVAAAAEEPLIETVAELPEVLPEPPAETGTDELEILREGEFLEAVLTNRLSGDFTGPVNAMVSADVYDRSRQRLLVPRGTRALGEAVHVESWEQSRLAVVFHRMVLPDGRTVSLGASPGLNQLGETGLKDLVDRRYASAFFAAGAVGALAGLSQAVSPQEAFTSRLASARHSTGAGLSRSAERILDRYLNRLPKVTIREGHRMRIYLTADLAIRPYHDPPGQLAAAPTQGDSQ